MKETIGLLGVNERDNFIQQVCEILQGDFFPSKLRAQLNNDEKMTQYMSKGGGERTQNRDDRFSLACQSTISLFAECERC